MPNIQNTASFQAPSDFNVEAQRIARQKALAQALQEQGMQQDGGTQVVGGWAIPNSPLVGLGKMAQVLSGKYQENKAIEEEKKLAERSNADRRQTLARAMALGQGTPDLASDPSKINMAYVNNGTMSDAIPELRPQPTVTPTTPQQRNLAIANLLASSQHPDLRAQGEKLMLEALTKENDGAGEKYGHTPQIEMINGQPHAVLYGDRGTRKVVGAVTPRDKFNTQTADNEAKLAQAQNQWNGLSANQQAQLSMEAARLGISAQQLLLERGRLQNQSIETNYNTGGGAAVPNITIPTIPQFSMPPYAPTQPAPMQPAPTGAPTPAAPPVAPRPAINQPRPAINQPRPQPAFAHGATTPGGQPLPPRLQNELTLAGEKQKQEFGNKRDFNMGGLNQALDEAQDILTGKSGAAPTASGAGSLVDSAASFFGVAPKGAPEADKLRAIAGTLTLKMPRMEGPQSDRDALLYREMAGQVGDSSLPIARRLAALQTVRDLYSKYDKQSTGGASGGWDGADRRQAPRSPSNRVVVDY